ncbi:MAG: hypothetical protein GYB41_03000, partial [Oceanospirillales bacterium]|nr:hypothetical protein [Oceanospirillales bacterium]
AYPAQQSFMIIKTSYIHKFINRFLNIKSKDNQISPELKFSIASSCILSSIPEFLYRFIEKRGPLNKVARVIVYGIISVFKGYDHVPYGYGRCRPINFEEKHYYFQHGSIDELMNFKNIE